MNKKTSPKRLQSITIFAARAKTKAKINTKKQTKSKCYDKKSNTTRSSNNEFSTGDQIIISGLQIFLDHKPSRTLDQNILITLLSLPPFKSFFRHSYCAFWGVVEQKLVIIGQWSSKSTFSVNNYFKRKKLCTAQSISI